MSLHRNDVADRKNAATSVIATLAQRLGRPPTQNEYKSEIANLDAPTTGQILYLFSTWTAAIEAAGLTPNENKPPRNALTVAELVTEFVAIANNLQRFPTLAEFGSLSQYSVRPYTRRWQNWSGVKRYFADKYSSHLTFTPILRKQKPRPSLRKQLQFDGPLCFQPQNEMETIVLFSLMADRLGYRIRTVRADFPDAELEKDGEIILAEFEYASSNYIQHGHDLNADCICICWRNDRDLGSIPVIALEDVLRGWQ